MFMSGRRPTVNIWWWAAAAGRMPPEGACRVSRAAPPGGMRGRRGAGRRQADRQPERPATRRSRNVRLPCHRRSFPPANHIVYNIAAMGYRTPARHIEENQREREVGLKGRPVVVVWQAVCA